MGGLHRAAAEAAEHAEAELDAQRQIRNLNQIVSHAVGRLDVLHKILNGNNDNPRDTLYNARRFINKGHENLDRMIENHSNGDPCID